MAKIKQEDRLGHTPELPENIRGLFRELCQEVAFVNAVWQFYLELFTDDANTAMFNEVASSSFKIIEHALRTEITMGLCRLSDPAGKGKRSRCSMLRLASQAGPIDGLEAKVDEFVSHCGLIHRLRNRLTAHAELRTALEVHPDPLPGVGRENINEAIQLADEALNILLRHYTVEQELGFEAPYIGGADSLIYWLNRGLEAEEAERQKLLSATASK